MKMNGYKLTRDWFEWCKHNPEKIKPIHTAIYLYAVETSNRLGWVEKFGFPTDSVMQVLGIGSWRTYSKTLNEIVSFGFLRIIRKSTNQHQSAIIAIVKNAVADTLAQAQAEQEQTQEYVSSTAVINKPNKTNKPINNKTRETLLAFDFINKNSFEFMEYFKTEYGHQIKDKKNFVTKFNNKVIEEKIKLEETVLMARLENYAISWIDNQKNTVVNDKPQAQRPNYF